MFHSVAQRPEKSTLNPILSEPSIFRALAAHQQDQYFKDMDCLRVRRPDLLTHVTEYVPEIVEFVKRIMENGYAYEDEGSVYFNTVVFDSSENHPYAMIEHWSKGNRELIAEGEGWSLGKYEQNLEMMSKFTQVCSRLLLVNVPRRISLCEKHRNPGNPHGRHRGVLDALVGILNLR
jgi:hypothetical protein